LISSYALFGKLYLYCFFFKILLAYIQSVSLRIVNLIITVDILYILEAVIVSVVPGCGLDGQGLIP
jgi:hypothetical protein